MKVEKLRVLLSALTAALAVAAPVQPSYAQDAQAQQIAAQGKGPAVPACVGCHGPNGQGSAAFPRLGGTGEAYLASQLEAFANGSRQNAVMQPIAKALSAAERAAMATYYSRLPAPLRAADAAQPTPADTGAWLAARGRWSDQLPACAQCHGPGGSGVGAAFPPLAGQSATYITAQLQAWKNGTRPPGPLGLMPVIAKKLTDADMSAVGAYYEGLPAAPAAAAAGSAAPAASAAAASATRQVRP